MTKDELAALYSLRSRGYAVTVFIPEELVDTTREEVEYAMVEAGVAVIALAQEGKYD